MAVAIKCREESAFMTDSPAYPHGTLCMVFGEKKGTFFNHFHELAMVQKGIKKAASWEAALAIKGGLEPTGLYASV